MTSKKSCNRDTGRCPERAYKRSSGRDSRGRVRIHRGVRSIPADPTWALLRQSAASASLKPGEVVVDLGSGGGLDVFLAAQKVGPTGRAIGIDMTQEMIELARRNAIKAGDGKPPANVEFHLAMIDDLPLHVRFGRLRHQQLRDQPGRGQACRLSGNGASAQAGRTTGHQRHCTQKADPTGSRPGGPGLRRLRGRRDSA